VGSTFYVGRGGRTNAEGIKQLRSMLQPLGVTVVAVPLTKVLHLKSSVRLRDTGATRA
jgi:dimethylargininase